MALATLPTAVFQRPAEKLVLGLPSAAGVESAKLGARGEEVRERESEKVKAKNVTSIEARVLNCKEERTLALVSSLAYPLPAAIIAYWRAKKALAP